MRDLGTVVRGIRTPIIKENDDLESIVVESIMNASKNNGFEFHDRDIRRQSARYGQDHKGDGSVIVLAADTSNSTCCAGIFDGKKPVAYEVCNDKRTHSETFMPLVSRVMEQAGMSFDQIDYFAVCVGPGSFTGIRIGISAVKGMALAAGKQVVPVSSTLALALSCEIADDQGRNTYFIPCFDARNKRVFAQMLNARTNEQIIEENAYNAYDLVHEVKLMAGSSKPRIRARSYSRPGLPRPPGSNLTSYPLSR